MKARQARNGGSTAIRTIGRDAMGWLVFVECGHRTPFGVHGEHAPCWQCNDRRRTGGPRQVEKTRK